MKKKRSLFRTVAGLTVVAAAAWASASAALADLYVIESTTATIKVGARLGDADKVDIPAGAQIRAVLPSGKTQTIRGPYQGPAGDLAKGQPTNEGVVSWLKNILLTGGATEATPGAVRSIGRAQAKPRTGFSWSAIPVTVDGPICIEKAASLQLVRAPSSRAERITVVDAVRSERGEAQWEANIETAAWPAGLAPRADGIYDLIVQGRSRRQVTLRVLERLPADADVLTELHRLGCKYQFESWVQERMAAK
jgi:hypothetical protein